MAYDLSRTTQEQAIAALQHIRSRLELLGRPIMSGEMVEMARWLDSLKREPEAIVAEE